jgi:Arc/MetJ-type ribon-helix-helix transcriptional regulator
MTLAACIAKRYAERMTQLVTRISDALAAAIDDLVAEGVVTSRSDAVRRGLEALIDEQRRRRTAAAIIGGYQKRPQRTVDVGWSDAATVAMIKDEPW